MKNTTAILLIISAIGFFGYLVINNSNYVDVENKVTAQNNGEYQKVIIGMKNYNYYPNTISVKVNEPVRIYLDNTVGGCFRDLTLRDFGIHEYLQTPEDYVEFTPTEKGTYTFACSMGMGSGKLIVE